MQASRLLTGSHSAKRRSTTVIHTVGWKVSPGCPQTQGSVSEELRTDVTTVTSRREKKKKEAPDVKMKCENSNSGGLTAESEL